MKIWKLSPIDPDSPDWCNSDYQGVAIIRAEDEREARDIADHAFRGLPEKVSPCQKTPSSPWGDSAVTKCIELKDSEYDTKGLAKVLEPKDFDEEPDK